MINDAKQLCHTARRRTRPINFPHLQPYDKALHVRLLAILKGLPTAASTPPPAQHAQHSSKRKRDQAEAGSGSVLQVAASFAAAAAAGAAAAHQQEALLLAAAGGHHSVPQHDATAEAVEAAAALAAMGSVGLTHSAPQAFAGLQEQPLGFFGTSAAHFASMPLPAACSSGGVSVWPRQQQDAAGAAGAPQDAVGPAHLPADGGSMPRSSETYVCETPMADAPQDCMAVEPDGAPAAAAEPACAAADPADNTAPAAAAAAAEGMCCFLGPVARVILEAVFPQSDPGALWCAAWPAAAASGFGQGHVEGSGTSGQAVREEQAAPGCSHLAEPASSQSGSVSCPVSGAAVDAAAAAAAAAQGGDDVCQGPQQPQQQLQQHMLGQDAGDVGLQDDATNLAQQLLQMLAQQLPRLLPPELRQPEAEPPQVQPQPLQPPQLQPPHTLFASSIAELMRLPEWSLQWPGLQQQLAEPATAAPLQQPQRQQPAAVGQHGPALAGSTSGGMLGRISSCDLLSVANSCLHEVIDLRLAALLAPQDSSCLPILQQAVVVRQQQQQQRAQPGQPLHAYAGAGAAAAAAAQPAPTVQPERVVALSVIRQFLQLLDDPAASQGPAAAATERTHVLDALNQLQQALSALQRATAGALQDPGSDAKTCLGEWVADNLGLPPSTSINVAVARLALLL